MEAPTGFNSSCRAAERILKEKLNLKVFRMKLWPNKLKEILS